MKNLLLTISGLLLFAFTYGQGIEVSIQADATFFRYDGQATSLEPFYGGGPPYVYNNWGSGILGHSMGLGYASGIQVQYVTKGGFIAGLEPEYELMKSNINLKNPDNDFGPTLGHFYYKTQYISFNPYLGYRINAKPIKVDFTAGLDFALGSGDAHGYGSAVYEGHNYQITSGDYGAVESDTRAVIALTAWHKRFGLTATYSYGLRNFTPNTVLTTGGTYSEVLCFGLCYRIL